MKQILSLLVLFTLTYVAQATHPASSVLNISLHDQAAFNVIINGKPYNHQASSYSIAELQPGRHFVEIIRFDRVHNGRSYVFSHPRVIFSDYIRLGSGIELTGYINHRHRFVETSKIARVHVPAPVQQVRARPNRSYPVRMAMDQRSFMHLKQSLEQSRNDSHRMNMARQATAAGYLSSGQVRELMLTFKSESSRLEYAKFAYPYTLDPQNYHVVHTSLRSPASSRNLHRYLARNF